MSDILSPLWEVYIDGRKLESQKRFIKNITIEETMIGSNICTINIVDEDSYFVSDSMFVDDAPIKVEILWVQGHKETFEGFVSAIDIVFPEDGLTLMNLFCLDNTHRMNKKKRSRTFEGYDKKGVLTSIAREYGFGCVVSDGYNTESTSFSQSKATDIEFCEGLNSDEAFGSFWRTKLIDNVLYYGEYGQLSSPVATFNYKSGKNNIIQFSPKITTEVEEPETANGGSGGGGISGGGNSYGNKIPTWKVTFPDGSIAFYKSLKEAQKKLDEARKAAGTYPPPIVDMLSPLSARVSPNPGNVHLISRADNPFRKTLAPALPVITLPQKGSGLLPLGNTMKLFTKVGTIVDLPEKVPIMNNVKGR